MCTGESLIVRGLAGVGIVLDNKTLLLGTGIRGQYTNHVAHVGLFPGIQGPVYDRCIEGHSEGRVVDVGSRGSQLSLVEQGLRIRDVQEFQGLRQVHIPKQPEDTLPRLWSLRGGLFYDEEPASGRPSGNRSIEGDGKPDRFYGFAVGAGLLAFQRVNIDLAYQFRYGNGVNGDFVRGVPGFEEDFIQHRVLLSTVIYF